MDKIRLAFAITGSFCCLKKSFNEARKLSKIYDLIPIMSFNVAKIDTRFGKSDEIKKEFESICGKPIINTIEDAEPIGPKNMCDVMAICPCTGNTLSKISNAVTDTPVTMAAKSNLRVQKPLVICFASNDALGNSFQNIAKMMNTKNVYFTQMKQDDPKKKPNSLVAKFDLLYDTILSALNHKQIFPVFV